MSRKKELNRISKIKEVYHAESISGANEQYHISLRDLIIPERGGHSALELGCGKGIFTKKLCELYNSVDVVDGSTELLNRISKECNHLRAKLKTHSVLVEDFTPSPGQTWQHIYMTFLLEHLQDPVAVLKRFKPLLAKDGWLFLAVPNANSLHRAIAFRMGLIKSVDQLSENDKLVGHRRVYTTELIRSHVEAAGLKIISEKHFGLKPVNLKLMENWSKELISALCHSGNLCPSNAAYIAIEAH